MRTIHVALLLLALLAPCSLWAAAPHTGPIEPLKGVFTKGQVIVCAEASSKGCEGVVRLWHVPVVGVKPKKTPSFSHNCDRPLRWQVEQGYLWTTWRYNDGGGAREFPLRCRLDELLRGRVLAGPGDDTSIEGDVQAFSDAQPVYQTWQPLGFIESFDETVLWHDYLPLGREEILVFILDNFDIRGLAEGKKLTKPKWEMHVHRCQNTWDANKGKWGKAKWTEEERIEVGFKESFQVLAKGDAYYFLRQTGKLYVSPKPAKGKMRKIVPVYTDSKRRVVTFLTDADNNKTYLFCKPAKTGDKPTFFELSDKPKSVEYDAPKIDSKGMHPDLAQVLTCARVLSEHNLLPKVVKK
jgi:hypothetical protein